MIHKSCLLALFLVQICNSDSDGKKWVWGGGRRRSDDRFYTGLVSSGSKYRGELIAPSKPLFQASSNYGVSAEGTNEDLRYEVSEPSYERPPPEYRPERPLVRPTGPTGIYQPVPGNYRPEVGPSNGFRPMRPIENEFRPVGNGYQPPPTSHFPDAIRPGTAPNGRPILTGPVPSWEQQNPNRYRDYNKCKCVHSFNCNTPGIKFGSCDVDKQYCCYKARDNEGQNALPRPGITGNGLNYNNQRPVLAGPGGPVDIANKPIQVAGNHARPFRPFSNVDRYVDTERDLDEAYRKGLASAIYELYDRPAGQYQNGIQGHRDYYPNDYLKPTRQSMKYGLYHPSVATYARSSNTTITALSDVE